MSTLYNYYGYVFPAYFDAFKTHRNQYYVNTSALPRSSYPADYSSQNYHPVSFYRTSGYSPDNFSQYTALGMRGLPPSGFKQPDRHYRYQPTGPYAPPTQRHVPPRANMLLRNHRSNAFSQYETIRHDSNFPVIKNQTDFPTVSRQILGYHNSSGLPYPTWTRTNYRLRYSRPSRLQPKIRVIFTLPVLSYAPPPSDGRLNIPFFSFNRMTQPQCALPLPPPLPQISSLPLVSSLQQKIIQQYANPVTVLPFAPSAQSTQPVDSASTSPREKQRTRDSRKTKVTSPNLPPLPPGAKVISDEYVDKPRPTRQRLAPYANHQDRKRPIVSGGRRLRKASKGNCSSTCTCSSCSCSSAESHACSSTESCSTSSSSSTLLSHHMFKPRPGIPPTPSTTDSLISEFDPALASKTGRSRQKQAHGAHLAVYTVNEAPQLVQTNPIGKASANSTAEELTDRIETGDTASNGSRAHEQGEE